MKSFLTLALLVALLATTQAGKKMKKCKTDLKAAEQAAAAAEKAQAAAEKSLGACNAELEKAQKELAEIEESKNVKEGKACKALLDKGQSKDGVYTLNPSGSATFQAYCDMTNGGWTVFQRRVDASVDFYRGWDDYVKGFGDPSGSFWAGLDNIHALAPCTSTELWVTMSSVEGETKEARYSSFMVDGPGSGYKMSVAGYTGTAGDAMTYHNAMKFSTKDRDNDTFGLSCATKFKGAWWYGACHHSNPNGVYYNGKHSTFADGVNWFQFKGYFNSLKTIEFKVRSNCT